MNRAYAHLRSRPWGLSGLGGAGREGDTLGEHLIIAGMSDIDDGDSHIPVSVLQCGATHSEEFFSLPPAPHLHSDGAGWHVRLVDSHDRRRQRGDCSPRGPAGVYYVVDTTRPKLRPHR